MSKRFANYDLNAVAKYNPHLWQARELKSIFVARQSELKQIVKRVVETGAGVPPQHMLITGNRGMGKSTLLHRVALAIEEMPEYRAQWLPVRFPEEQYTVSNLAELWSNVLGALADALERNMEQSGAEDDTERTEDDAEITRELSEIDTQLQALESLPVGERESQALEWINQWCDRRRKRLLLLMDSTDLLFDNLNQGQGKTRDSDSSALWRLRDTLQHNPRLFWLGGSYQPLDIEGSYHDTFLDFFYIVELKPLRVKEMQAAMVALAETFGTNRHQAGAAAAREIRQIIQDSPERLATIHKLTGGNPRTTVLLYELYTSGSGDSIRQDVERLLDIVTPLYKARMEALADQPRKILAHILEHWAPVSLGVLHARAGLPKNNISPQLVRLEAEGLIVKTALPNTRRKGYQASERFFNIWYLMRNAPRRLRARLNWLILFMSLWYSKQELNQLARQRLEKHRSGVFTQLYDYEYSRAIASSLEESALERTQLEWQVFREVRENARQQLPEIFDLQGEDSSFASSEEYLKRLEVLTEQLGKVKWAKTDKERQQWSSLIKRSISLSLAEKERMAATALDTEKHRQLTTVLQAEEKRWISMCGEHSAGVLFQAIEAGNFFPDTPDPKIAFTQIEDCLAHDARR